MLTLSCAYTHASCLVAWINVPHKLHISITIWIGTRNQWGSLLCSYRKVWDQEILTINFCCLTTLPHCKRALDCLTTAFRPLTFDCTHILPFDLWYTVAAALYAGSRCAVDYSIYENDIPLDKWDPIWVGFTMGSERLWTYSCSPEQIDSFQIQFMM